MLGLDTTSLYKHSKFPTYGPLNEVGVTVPGAAGSFGIAEMWKQNQSIMAFTAGLAIVAPQDSAQFYYDLLGPEKKIVSEDSVKVMTEWTTLDMGWSKDKMNYGGGLMTTNANFAKPLDLESTTFVGHGGETYGYKST